MANHKSAEKRARQTEKRTERNRARRSRIRTFVKKAELAIALGRPEAYWQDRPLDIHAIE